MTIKVNDTHLIDVTESNLVVKDKRLYNTITKQFEGIDGDLVSFNIIRNNNVYVCSGIVDGYSYGDRVKLRGVNKEYKNVTDKKVEKVSVITDVIDEKTLTANVEIF